MQFTYSLHFFSNIVTGFICNDFLLAVNHFQLIPKNPNSYSENLLSVLLILSLIIYAIINVFYHRRLRQLIKSFVSHRFIYQLTRDGELLKENISLLLYSIYFISFSIIIYLTIKIFTLKFQLSIINYLLILGFIILLFFIKSGFIRFFGIIFKTNKESKEYLRLQYVFHQVTGLFLLPLLIIVIYLKLNMLLKLIFALLLLLLVYRLLRIIFYRIYPFNFSMFYLILYLCTIEILPLLIFFKLIYNHLSPNIGL